MIDNQSCNQKALANKKPNRTNKITIDEQIAYMIEFFSSPKFIQMRLDDTEASSNESSSSSQSIVKISVSDQKATQDVKSPRNKGKIGQYEMSEIKADNFGMVFFGNRIRQSHRQSAFETQFDYQELIAELTFQDQGHQQKITFSAQKYVQPFDEFNIKEKDISFASEKKQNINQRQELLNYHNATFRKEQTVKVNASQRNVKWDPPSEIVLRKQNQLKWLVHILENRYLRNQKEGFKKIKLNGQKKPCIKCKKPIRKSSIFPTCPDCRPFKLSLNQSFVNESKCLNQSSIYIANP